MLNTLLDNAVSNRNPNGKSSKNEASNEEDDEMDEKMNVILEMFPQLTRTEVLEVSRDGGFATSQCRTC